MSPRRVLVVLATAVLLALATGSAVAATADSVSVEVSNSKSLRRLAVFADVSECDFAGGYGCYTASFAVYLKGGRQVYKRALRFGPTGQTTGRYPWSCRYTGRLEWRVRVSDGETTATRRGRFNVAACRTSG